MKYNFRLSNDEYRIAEVYHTLNDEVKFHNHPL